VVTGVLYVRGWRKLHYRDRYRWHVGQPAAFLGGLIAIFLALASPIEPFSYFFLQVHMLQHLLLMMVAPPLLLLGAPMFPLLLGLPRAIRHYWIAPLLRSPGLRRVGTYLTQPLPALVLFVAATWFWHLPLLYGLALRSDVWHYLQHACFLITALLFWFTVVRPYPSRPQWSLWWLVAVLIFADVQNTILSALLTFADRVLYVHYAEVPRLGNISALEDQAAAGVLMWVPGSVAFLLPLFIIGLGLLFPPSASSRSRKAKPTTGPRRIALAVVPSSPASSRWDILNIPFLGRFLRWRHARLCLQIPLLLLAGIVVYDGFHGPALGPMNLAGVLPWIHWRGLLILGVLVFGNIFCMACPFMVPRAMARRWLPGGRFWPVWLRNKWLGVILLVGFLWAYEAFALWDSPWLTAWIVLAYFSAALVVDGFFRGASFCKYVCPIGQFNFVQSLVSPLEIKVRAPSVCLTCATKDCIRGREDIPGCELHLFLPRKASNLDCTFCLDCIHACPHDNIGILGSLPGGELISDRYRSGIGRWSRRGDLAALVLVLVFGAFVNAALMTGPVVDWQERLTNALDWHSPLWVSTGFFLVFLGLAPFLIVGSAAALSRYLGKLSNSWAEVLARQSFALVPIGFSMWLVHYSFHFVTSYATLVPTIQRFLTDLGTRFLGFPQWSQACCTPTAGWLLRLEMVFMGIGLLLSLYVSHRIALSQTHNMPRALGAFAPWAIIIFCLFLIGIWVLFQPMQMRGTMGMAG